MTLQNTNPRLSPSAVCIVPMQLRTSLAVQGLPTPPSLKIVAIPCTGRTDMGHMLKTFEDGADGVLVAGCLEGRCHFQTGNLYARQRVEHVADLLDQIGLESERARMINISAGMGAKFAELANEFAETISALGPTGLKKKPASRELPLPSGKTE